MAFRRSIDDSAENVDQNPDDLEGHALRSGRLMEDADTADVEGHGRRPLVPERTESEEEDVAGHGKIKTG